MDWFFLEIRIMQTVFSGLNPIVAETDFRLWVVAPGFQGVKG
jgi:hypothetical protein